MYVEILIKVMIVVALVLTFIWCWIKGDPDDYTFMSGIVGDPEKQKEKLEKLEKAHVQKQNYDHLLPTHIYVTPRMTCAKFTI